MPVQNLPAALNHHNLPLRDIHLPAAISWWPPAPGWWLILAAIICLVLVYVTVRKIRYRRRLKRATKATFETIKQQYLHSHDKQQLARNLSTFLRRASISFYPRHDTAGLTGKDWLNYLDSTLPDSAAPRFNSKPGQVLLTAPYMPDDNSGNRALDYDAEALLKLCRQWLIAQPAKQATPHHLQNRPQQTAPATANPATADSSTVERAP